MRQQAPVIRHYPCPAQRHTNRTEVRTQQKRVSLRALSAIHACFFFCLRCLLPACVRFSTHRWPLTPSASASGHAVADGHHGNSGRIQTSAVMTSRLTDPQLCPVYTNMWRGRKKSIVSASYSTIAGDNDPHVSRSRRRHRRRLGGGRLDRGCVLRAVAVWRPAPTTIRQRFVRKPRQHGTGSLSIL